MRALALLLFAISMPGAATPRTAQPAPGALATVRAFAEQYQRDAPSLVAREDYVQNATYRSREATHRDLTAELVMVRLQGAVGWVSFRDVLTVDKRPVSDREERLLKLLQSPAPNVLAQARKIAEESARFNLGTIVRTLNVPDMALEFLQARHGERMRFEALADGTIDGHPVMVFRFSELTGPSIVRNLVGRDLFARGRVWAEPGSGAIVRTELLIEDRGSNGAVTVDFQVEPRLGLRVPVKMTERYKSASETIDAVAKYSDFRRFTVGTTETLIKPPGR